MAVVAGEAAQALVVAVDEAHLGRFGPRDELVRLPMKGAVESLNVSVASGVCLYEAARQRRARAVSSTVAVDAGSGGA